MKNLRNCASTLGCTLLITLTAMAQTATTGSIEGKIADQNGAAVMGVTVNVASANLIRPQSTTAGADGNFRIPNLAPGKYTVTVEPFQGFAKYEQSNLEVNLSKTTTVEILLLPQGASTSVEVTASSNTIDTTSNTTGTNVTSDQFSNFPTQRTVQSLYSIAPTATRSGLRDASGRDRDPSVGGSSGPENNYILDGVNTTDPAFGGSGANLPFEFVQEVEIKTGGVSAEYGKTTGGIFNVITKSGSNEIHGDAFAYFTTKGLVRDTKNFSFTGAAPNGFSEIDAGGDIGGYIIKDRLWYFGAFNPQRRENSLLTQTFREEVENKVTTPFYAGKLTYSISDNHTLTFSTFGDFAKQTGFIQTGVFEPSGFGADPNSFQGEYQTGGHNYALRLNSTFSPTFIGEFALGLHRQRSNIIPDPSVANTPLVTDTFAILNDDGTIAPATQSNVDFINAAGQNLGPVAFVNAPNGSLQRNFTQQGFGLFQNEDRNRFELAARLQNFVGRHTLKYGIEFNRNTYNINQASTGPAQTFGNPEGLNIATPDNLSTNGIRVTNNYGVCTTRLVNGANTIICPDASITAQAALIATQAGAPGGAITDAVSVDEFNNNPFLVRLSTRVRDFQLHADTYTNVESFYLQDDFKLSRNITLLGGLRWDFQQIYGAGDASYIKLNKFFYNMQPRFGIAWDFTGKGRGRIFANYADYIEAPLPLDINVRAGGGDSQTDKNFNVDLINAPEGSNIVTGISANSLTGAVNLGASATPIDSDIRPQNVNEVTAGIEYQIFNDITIGARGIYRAQGQVIEDGSFDDGDTYFLFNPGVSSTEELAIETLGQGFGRARRYYRALEFTGTKRFSNRYQFITSYVYSSLIGNYEGLFRNDNGQSDPNITSLFDLVSLLDNSYGRLPNDRPHQFKFDGSYELPFGLLASASFRAQSGIPINQLIPHPIYGNNEGFGVPRGSLGRTPFTTNVDLGAYYPIKLGESKQLKLQLDWFNVFNTQRPVKLDETFTINSGVDGIDPLQNVSFLTGRIFQSASSLRFGIKFQF